jgi:hypothetical protein
LAGKLIDETDYLKGKCSAFQMVVKKETELVRQKVDKMAVELV